MKVMLELSVNEEYIFLNYWDSDGGDDVVTQIIDGKLHLIEYEDDKELPPKPITIEKFVELVKARN